MSISMYEASIPVFQRQLGNLSSILKKGEEDAQNRRIDPAVFLGARMAPDMFALVRQVQIATDMVKGGAMRLSGEDVPKFEDDEASFADLDARIRKTLDLIANVPEDRINGSEDRDIVLKFGPREMVFKGQSYLINFVLPNLYFHISMVYAILRHNGVPVGKTDFIGMT